MDVGAKTKGYPKPRIMEPRTETDLIWKKKKPKLKLPPNLKTKIKTELKLILWKMLRIESKGPPKTVEPPNNDLNLKP